MNAGNGVLLKYPDGTKSKYSAPCGKYCSNYVAEIQAMNKAVEILNSEFTNNAQHPVNIVIFTDSLSARQDLESNYQKTSTDLTALAQSLEG